MHKRGFGLVGILIAVAVIVFLAGGLYYFKSPAGIQTSTQTGIDAIKTAEQLKDKIEIINNK